MSVTGRAFPFSALVGQERMKLALLLNAINPVIGGVLIRGERGTAKSTAVRALAELLPLQAVVEGCHFGCDPADADALCTDCRERIDAGEDPLPVVIRQMRVVELPINASEDRVVGTIDLEAALREGVKRFEPGVLAEANRNVLYVDEVNLLDDHIVDVLLDSAATGVNVVEREGVSIVPPGPLHPGRHHEPRRRRAAAAAARPVRPVRRRRQYPQRGAAGRDRAAAGALGG